MSTSVCDTEGASIEEGNEIAVDRHVEVKEVTKICEGLHNNEKEGETTEKEARKVSFPKDCDLVTGYLEPVNPWAEVDPVSKAELCALYNDSCVRHNTEPLEVVLKHLNDVDLSAEPRVAVLDLNSHKLSHASCETLEEILKRIQYKLINLSSCGLDDTSATAIFDMVEYYEATNELDISDNSDIKNRGWASCINMIKRCQELKILTAQGTPISENNATSLGKALTTAMLHTLKLEHCGMTGRPIASLCTALRKTTVLKELWLADNDLNSFDAYNIATLLKTNLYIQFLHISNNTIKDEGVSYLSDAIVEQTRCLKEPISERNARTAYSELSASLNNLNNNKCLSPSFKKPDKAPYDEVEKAAAAAKAAEKAKIHLLGRSNQMNNNDDDEEEKKVKDNPKVEEVIELPAVAIEAIEAIEVIKTGEENANDTSPMNSKSLKEELESLKSAAPLPIDIPNFEEKQPVLSLPTVVSRSFSSESLNSLTSIDSNDSKSSIRITEAKFAKNGTLERQNSVTPQAEEPTISPTGLQVLVLWNNKLTKASSKPIADMISGTSTLEVLNVGRNNVGNDFVATIKASLRINVSLHTLGLQGTHLSCAGVVSLADIIQFGGNATLQRVDLRDNNVQQDGLEALNDALKSNKSITRIDLDDTPRKLSESVDSTVFNRLINNIKAHCDRNANPPVPIVGQTSATADQSCSPDVRSQTTSPIQFVRTTSLKKSSRKISLTCQNAPPQRAASSPSPILPSYPSSVTTIKSPPITHPASSVLLSSAPAHFSSVVVVPVKKSKSKSKCFDASNKNRLKSPLPSPIPSPLPSPSRNRFQVSKVSEGGGGSSSCGLSPLSAGSLSTGSSPTFFPPSRFSVTRVVLPPTPVQVTSLSSSTLDSALSSSVESPDMEVKRYMNDSCSSLDSMDHLHHDHHHHSSNNDLNVSMSSTESFDFILRDIPTVNVEPTITPTTTTTTSSRRHPPDEVNKFRLNNSLSSLDVSASSQESLADNTSSAGESSPKISSNEGTLTNSPCDKEGASTPVRNNNTTTTDSGNSSGSTSRTRKNSWIPNPISMAKSDSGTGYPATLDKLFSLFQHPSAIFQRSSPDTTKELSATIQQQQQQPPPPIRGLSLPGWVWATGKKEDELKGVLQPNQSSSDLPPETIPFPDTISPEQKQEVKENISPENTITTSNNSIKPEKVIFELGDDEEEEPEKNADQPEIATTSLQGSIVAATQKAAGNHHHKNNSNSNSEAASTEEPLIILRNSPGMGGLGHIARDSLSILKGGTNTSQDSMRSLDSLPEFEFVSCGGEVDNPIEDIPVFFETDEEKTSKLIEINKQSPEEETVSTLGPSEAVVTEVGLDMAESTSIEFSN